MKRPRSILGALLLCALCVGAFGAANASATTLYVCEKVEKGTGTWADSKCEETGGAKEFKTVATPQGIPTALAGTGTGTVSIEIGAFTGGVASIECTKQSTTGTATNSLVGGLMQSIGKEITFKFSSCTMPSPTGQSCKVQEPLEIKGVSSSTFMKTEAETRVEFTSAFETLMEFTIEGCKSLKDMKLQVVGKLIGVPNGSSLVFSKESSVEGGLSLGGQAFTISGSMLITASEKRTMLE